jgi:hypothetical protein
MAVPAIKQLPILTSSLGVALAFGCATPRGEPIGDVAVFVAVEPESQPWYDKVRAWQERSHRDPHSLPEYPLISPDEPLPVTPAKEAPPLRVQLDRFAAQEQRDLARRINRWSQRSAFWHYEKDEDDTPASDIWPTFGELLENNGDDCDGLDLMAYQLLLRFGFDGQVVYRAVFRRNRDGANHMVTLWFESKEDPWVLDSTRAASSEMVRMSTIRGWTPVVMFNQDHVFDFAEPRS